MKTLGRTLILENLKEIINPEHTAIVIWDCQNFLIKNSFNREEFINNVKTILESARSRSIPVIYTRISPTNLSDMSAWDLYYRMKRYKINDPSKIPVLKQGSPEIAIHPMLTPLEGDVVLDKNSPSIFFGTYFEQLMRNRHIRTICFTGISTEIGIEHCARDAAVRGFYPVIISDCISSGDHSMHEMALKVMEKMYLVYSSSEIVEEWRK